MPQTQLRYFLIFKPFGMLSQFSGEAGDSLLGDLFAFPKDVYPVGRLDKDSEGLLLLTNDKALNHRLLDPKFAHSRSYLVQVEGEVTPKAISALTAGTIIRINKKDYRTKPAVAESLDEAPLLPPRDPPIRYRKSVPTSWIRLTLREGKNRQVRRMTAAVGFPTLRLVREKIEDLSIENLPAGGMQELDRETVYKKLFGRS